MAQQQKETSIKLISECFVKPKHEVEASKQPYHLSPPEIGMVTIDPIQKGLLFAINNPPSNDRNEIVSSLLEKLEQSLSIALVHFYPLAGRFVTEKYPDEHACSIYIDCNKGPGARLIHATALDVKVSDIVSSTDIPSIVRSFFELGDNMSLREGNNILEELKVLIKNEYLNYTGGNQLSMSALDMSCYKVTGLIPLELGEFEYIHSLNLSHNYLSGPIPNNFSNLKQIEGLYLSFNNLSGNILSQLVDELNFLAVFNVSYNNLSERIPDAGQFGDYDQSNYLGNPKGFQAMICTIKLKHNHLILLLKTEEMEIKFIRL